MITQQEIAERLGVSQETVSRVLHRTHSARVNPERREEILRVAAQMGYKPRRRTTHVVGYVATAEELQEGASTGLLVAVEEALQRRGFRLMLASGRFEDLNALRETLSPKTVDAAIFTRWPGRDVTELLMPEVPIVLTSDEESIPSTVDNITHDTVRTLENVARYLIELGHRRLCLFTGTRGLTCFAHMQEGARAAFVGAGLPLSNLTVVQDMSSYEVGAFALEIMRKPNAPTGIITYNTENSLVLLNYLQAGGFKVPEQVSLVSALDGYVFPVMSPAITATSAVGKELGERIVQRVVEKINDPHSAARQEKIVGEIVERASATVPYIGR